MAGTPPGKQHLSFPLFPIVLFKAPGSTPGFRLNAPASSGENLKRGSDESAFELIIAPDREAPFDIPSGTALLADMSEPATQAALFDRLGGRTRLLFLLKHFYADVRQHNLIGPIFAAQIKDWPAHLEKIADFWSGASGGPANYRGPMPQRHFPLGLGETHFEAWLDLWRRHCRAHLGAQEAAEMIKLAEGIGERLRELISRYGTKPAN